MSARRLLMRSKKIVASDMQLATTWRRVQDSNPRGHHCPNGFQDRPVMTASVTLQHRQCTTPGPACQSCRRARITSPASQGREKARSVRSFGTFG